MIQFNKVTWYSKLAAVVFFIGILPAWAFCIGRQYQETRDIYKNIPIIENVDTNPIIENKEPEIVECDDKDTSTSGMAQCIYVSSQKEDTKMDTVYNKLIKYLDMQISDGKEYSKGYVDLKNDLITSQESWLEYRDEYCTVYSGISVSFSGTISRLLYPGCKQHLTEGQTKELESLYKYWTEVN